MNKQEPPKPILITLEDVIFLKWGCVSSEDDRRTPKELTWVSTAEDDGGEEVDRRPDGNRRISKEEVRSHVKEDFGQIQMENALY
jgi:hypothetical protein